MASMQTAVPARKVIGSSLGAAVATVVLYFLDTHVLATPLPDGTTEAITVLIVFLVGYFLPPSSRDQVLLDSDEHV